MGMLRTSPMRTDNPFKAMSAECVWKSHQEQIFLQHLDIICFWCSSVPVTSKNGGKKMNWGKLANFRKNLGRTEQRCFQSRKSPHSWTQRVKSNFEECYVWQLVFIWPCYQWSWVGMHGIHISMYSFKYWVFLVSLRSITHPYLYSDSLRSVDKSSKISFSFVKKERFQTRSVSCSSNNQCKLHDS